MNENENAKKKNEDAKERICNGALYTSLQIINSCFIYIKKILRLPLRISIQQII